MQQVPQGIPRAPNYVSVKTGGSRSVSFFVPSDEIMGDDITRDLQGVDRQVVIRKVGGNYPGHVAFQWTEAAAPDQLTAYWVRVLQEEGATAWSSPIFVSTNE